MKEVKYSLSALSCASCADKIEQKVSQLDAVEEASLNFITKEIKVQVKDTQNTDDLFHSIQKIVDQIENDVVVCEVNPKLIYLIEGLDCANCAAKIEDKLNKTEGILSARVDFISKKLSLSLANNSSEKLIIEKAKKIIDQIESGVTIEKIDHANHKILEKEDPFKKDLVVFAVGLLLFMGALLVTKGTIIYYGLYALSYLIIGGKVVFKAFKNIYHGKVFDENFLMTIATMGAFIIGEHPEAIAVMIFYKIGEFFQDLAVNRSRKSIKSLMSLRPDVATIKNGDYSIEMNVEDVQIGQIMIIKPGERIPMDGQVLTGESLIDTKILTGESIPINVSPGEKVLSGCINLNGLLTAKVTELASNSTVSKVLELVENASSKKAPTEKFITKFARVYTPIVTGLAVLIAIVPPLLFKDATFSEWIYRALILLVISCPCALVISIPLGFFGGIGAASRNGILIKGSNYLEALNDIEIAVFDKTGTLTKGSFTVTEINALGAISKESILEKAAHVESFSNHPIALSIVNEYNQKIHQKRITDINEIAGYGVRAIYQGEQISIGNARMMEKENINFQESMSIGSVLYMAINGQYVGNIIVSDQLKIDSKKTIQMLKILGVKKTVMLTGDKKTVADTVGKELMIDEIYSELLPEDKLTIVEKLILQTSKKGKLLFVGDGINDTPVIARADIGVAMGGLGADAAIDVADVVIMNDEPSKIGTAIFVAKRTRKIVWQNIYFALGIKLAFLLLGAIGVATMWEAVIADVGVTLLAVLNSMRMLKYTYNQKLLC